MAGGSFEVLPIVSPRHCPLPPHPPHWQPSPDIPRGSAAAGPRESAAAGPREFPRQHCGRRASRGAADACAAVARLGGGEIILETGSGDTALGAGSKAAHRVEPHEDGEKAHHIISPRDGGDSRGSVKHSRASGGHYNLFSRSSSRDDAHSRGSFGDDAHSRGSGGGDDGHSRASGGDDAHSRASSGHYNLFSRSSTRKERAVAAATSAATAVATAAVATDEPSLLVARQMTSGSAATSYCGSDSSFGDQTAGVGFPARYHDPLSASPHARAFPPRLPHPPSPSSCPFPFATGVAAAAAAAAATPAGAEADTSAIKKRLSAMMQFPTWEQQQKERQKQQDAAASTAQHALRQAQEELLFPKFHAPGQVEPLHAPKQPPQQPPQQQLNPLISSAQEAKLLETKLPPGVPTFGSRAEHSATPDSSDHGGGVAWGRGMRRGYGECGGVESGTGGSNSGVVRPASRGSGDGGVGWGRDEGRSNTLPGGHGMWGREQGTSGGESGGVRLRDVGKVDREGGGMLRSNWECGSVGWDHGESHSMGSNASSSVDNSVANSSYGQSSSHGNIFESTQKLSHHARDSAYHTRNAHHYSPPVGHVSHGYADSASGAAAAFMPSPPGSTPASSGGMTSGHVATSHVAPSNVASGHVASNGGCRVFSPEQLVAATNGFHPSNLLGAGAFGQVYKGILLGCEVAIKKLEGNGWQGEEEYGTEVHVLSRMRHPHIVLLMAAPPSTAFAATNTMPALCRPLSWPDRIRILSEISGALLYLHQHSPPIAHRDLKPQNILLDTSLRAKLADVGLARLIDCGNGDEYNGGDGSGGYGGGGGGNVTARVRGTVGYIDPEELVTCEVSVLGDVYALGVVMLQMLMGIPEWDRGAAAEVAAIAICCTNRRRASRPDLEREVHEVLMQLAEESVGCAGRQQDASNSHLLCPLSKVSEFIIPEREVREVLMPLAEESAGCAERQQDAANSHLLCPLSKVSELIIPEREVREVLMPLAEESAGCAERQQDAANSHLLCPLSKVSELIIPEREVREVLMPLAEESAGCAERQQDAANSHLLCPLSKMRMREPVVAADGYTYEKTEIEKWMETSSRSPITGELFAHPMLTPNNAMSVIIK
ncbi:unnamed protein product [Closterium sp. Yama58-4]|nr:unnamed protein product [Closterium sp. Yama58-4]